MNEFIIYAVIVGSKENIKGQSRLKTGFPGIFPEDLEADFTLFIKHCQFLRIPRSKTRFKQDIVHYVEFNNLEFKKMQEDGPGNSYLMYNVQRFRNSIQ